ncbi:MAG: hypothetical protein KC731_02150 [Myxococcales bacterium]|nr:hypothetical protein [Myxococcales bacterium]
MRRYLAITLFVSPFVAAIGCSEAVPPAGEAAVSVNFSTASAVGTPGSCTVAPHDFQIGVVHPSDTGQIIFTKDGQARASVFCSVTEDGGSFNASAQVLENEKSFEFAVKGISDANTKENPAKGTVTYRSVDTVNFFTSTSEYPCEFWLNDQQEVGPGKLWAQYSCPLIQSNTKECSIGESTVALQNCDS